MKWQLEWKQLQQKDQETLSRNVLTLSLKLVPTIEFQEKLGDVWIDIGYVTSQAGESPIIPSKRTVVLRKSNSYQYDLMSEESAISVKSFKRKITVDVEITVIKNTLDIIEEVNVPSCTELHDFSTLLAFNEKESKEKYYDVTLALTCREDDNKTQVKFYAHRAILATRSPVFAKMFSHDVQESVTNTIELSDIEPEVLKELLTYIYTSESPNIKTHAASLLYHAQKYQLVHLKALCERCLSYDLQIDNAARIFLLADAYEAKQLKRNAMLFINEHRDKVPLTKEWEEVKKSAELLNYLFCKGVSTSCENRKLECL